MEKVMKTIDEHTTDFSNKIDRLVKDVAHRFKDYTKFNIQLKHLESTVEHFKNMKTDEKLTQKWEQVSKQ